MAQLAVVAQVQPNKTLQATGPQAIVCQPLLQTSKLELSFHFHKLCCDKVLSIHFFQQCDDHLGIDFQKLNFQEKGKGILNHLFTKQFSRKITLITPPPTGGKSPNTALKPFYMSTDLVSVKSQPYATLKPITSYAKNKQNERNMGWKEAGQMPAVMTSVQSNCGQLYS